MTPLTPLSLSTTVFIASPDIIMMIERNPVLSKGRLENLK